MKTASYAEVRRILKEHTGAEIKYERTTLRDLHKYIKRRGFGSSDAYLKHVREHLDEELDNLKDWGLVHATEFVRDPKFWAALYQEAILKTPLGTYRVLSLGCSVGHELATVAVLAAYRFRAGVSVRGFDISAKVVEDAKDPKIDRRLLKRLPVPAMGQLLQQKVPEGFARLIPEVLACLSVHVGDARTVELEPYYYDLVLCRNLPYYFDPPVAEALYQRISETLKHGGYMGIGSVDPAPPKRLFEKVSDMLYRCILPQR